MSDAPPRRKKSRFFSEGKSRVETLLRGIAAQPNAANQPLPSDISDVVPATPRQQSQTSASEVTQTPTYRAATLPYCSMDHNIRAVQDEINRRSSHRAVDGSGLLRRSEQISYNMPSSASLRPEQTSYYVAFSSSTRPGDTLPGNSNHNGHPTLQVKLTRVHPVAESGDDGTAEPKAKRAPLGESAFQQLTVRDARRDGIYGRQALLERPAGRNSCSEDTKLLPTSKLSSAAFGNNTLANTPFKPVKPPSPPPLASTAPMLESKGPPYEVYRILQQDYETAVKDSKRTGRSLASYYEKITLPNEPFWSSDEAKQAMEATGASMVHKYRLESVRMPLVARKRPGHWDYAPLAQGYQAHPVHGQLPLPEADYRTRLHHQYVAIKAADEAAQASNMRVNATGSSHLPPPDPNLTPSSVDPVKAQHFLPSPTVLVDFGKDSNGSPRPRQTLNPIPNLQNRGITNLPFHATATPTRRPTHPILYTSPDRMNFALVSASSRKRKRTDAILPPPAYVHIHTGDPSFKIFNHILLYPELVFHLAAALTVNDLIALYSISSDFHTILDTRFTTVILSQSLAKAPTSSRIFAFRSYWHLCRTDPLHAARGTHRLVPSFRWLRMIMHREKAVHELLAIFAEDGVPLPPRCDIALKRLWFLLDIPDNARRIGYMHNRGLFTDLDLYFAMAFFVKLDMRLNDPVAPECRHGMRKMLLAQQSFTTLLKVLKRDIWRKQIDVLREWVKYRYSPAEDELGLDIFGVPAALVGRGKLEYWGTHTAATLGREPQTLLRPDQLVMREAVRRGIRFHKHFLRCMLYGYVDPVTLQNYPPREHCGRRIPELQDEYGVDDEIGSAEVPDGGMKKHVLDIGPSREVSLLCVKKENREDDRIRREEEEQWIGLLYEWSRDEWKNLMDVDD